MEQSASDREFLLYTTAGAKLWVAVAACSFFLVCGLASFSLVPRFGVVPAIIGVGSVFVAVLLGLGALERRSPVRLRIEGPELIVRQRTDSTSMEVVRVADIVGVVVEVESRTDSDGDRYEAYRIALEVASGEAQPLAAYHHMTNRDEAERLKKTMEAFLGLGS